MDVAVAMVAVVVQVAAAEACGGDADLEFVCFGGGEGAGFLRVVSGTGCDQDVVSDVIYCS